MKRYLHILIISIIAPFALLQANDDVLSKLLPQVTPMTPEAASLAKYINYPVSHATGLINITIPLYEINVSDIKLPITLSYHSSGLKVNDRGDWVGAGWTLNAEPTITRVVDGKPDEEHFLDEKFFDNEDMDKWDKKKLG